MLCLPHHGNLVFYICAPYQMNIDRDNKAFLYETNKLIQLRG